MSDLEARIRASFARQTIMQTFGAEMLEVGRGSVVIAAPVAPHLLQQAGSAHAALTFGIGDSAAGYSALTTLPADSDVVTVEMKINLLAPAVGSRLIATGRVLRAGRRIVTVQSDVEAEAEDGSRKPVAVMQGTMVAVSA